MTFDEALVVSNEPATDFRASNFANASSASSSAMPPKNRISMTRLLSRLSENLEALDFWLFDLVTGEQRQLTKLTNKGSLRGFYITPDGKHIVFDRTQQNSDIVLLDRPKK